MKEKKLTSNSTNPKTNKKVLFESAHLKKAKDIHYLQINKLSFQQNFKILMGHFKEDYSG